MFGLGNKKKTIAVEGMTCHHCEMAVEKALLEIGDIKSAKADHARKTVEVQFANELDMNLVRGKIEAAGYKISSD